MTPSQERHLSRYPKARKSTLRRLEARDLTTDRLINEMSERLGQELAEELERSLSDMPQWQRVRIRESW